MVASTVKIQLIHKHPVYGEKLESERATTKSGLTSSKFSELVSEKQAASGKNDASILIE